MKNSTLLIILLIIQIANANPKDSIQTTKIINPKNIYLNNTKTLDDDCDSCGCSASGGSMGFASIITTNFLGIRYFNQQYKSTDGLYSNSPWYTENFNTIQLWSRIPITKKIQLSALLPYHSHHKQTETGDQQINGIGDATLLAMYTLYNTQKENALFTHTLQLGLGTKIPTGKFNTTTIATTINPSFQLGTGSWDFIYATEYVIKIKKFGLNAMYNYILKNENKNQYKFGDQINYAATFFYLHQGKKFAAVPQLGLAGEIYQNNRQYAQNLRKTDGSILFTKLAIEIGLNKLTLGVNTMLPIVQNLTGSRVQAQSRWSININYSL